MADIKEVVELIEEMSEDTSIPRNVRAVIDRVKSLLNDDSKEIQVKVDTAMQEIEEVSLDPNMSSHARTQIWNLTSLLEELLNHK